MKHQADRLGGPGGGSPRDCQEMCYNNQFRGGAMAVLRLDLEMEDMAITKAMATAETMTDKTNAPYTTESLPRRMQGLTGLSTKHSISRISAKSPTSHLGTCHQFQDTLIGTSVQLTAMLACLDFVISTAIVATSGDWQNKLEQGPP